MRLPLLAMIVGLGLMVGAVGAYAMAVPLVPGDDCAGTATGGEKDGGGWELETSGSCIGEPCSIQTNGEVCWVGCSNERQPGGCCTLTLDTSAGMWTGDIGTAGDCPTCDIQGRCDVTYDNEGDNAQASCLQPPITDPEN